MTEPLAQPSVYIIAGEASGDFIGSHLLASLNQQPHPPTIHGIGGSLMQSHGLSSLFPMDELSVMGFAEVLPHIFRLKRRIRETVADIERQRPSALVTIDSPGFTFRVVKQLRERGHTALPCIHIVAPTVWAYKPERAAKTAALFNRLLCILPFEPPYFEKEGLQTNFIGHPSAWYWRDKGDGAAFRTRHQIAPKATTLCMLPGSRMGEIRRHLPIYEQTARQLHSRLPALEIIMPHRATQGDYLRTATAHWPMPVHLVDGNAEKKDAFAACDVALAKSGTVALETALAGLPTITTYRANPISVWLIRRMIRTPYVNLLNILAGKAIIPELLQEECRPDTLTEALWPLLSDPAKRQHQTIQYAAITRQLLTSNTQSPGDLAATILSEYTNT